MFNSRVNVMKFPVLFLVFVVQACVPILHYILGLNFFIGDSIIAFSYIVLFFVSCSLGYIIFLREDSRNYVLWMAVVLVFVGLVSVWISLIQWLGLDKWIWVHDMPAQGRPFGNLGQPNNYSTLILFSYFSLYFIFEKKKVSRISYLFSSAFFILGLSLAQSRTTWLVLLCLILLVTLSFWVFKKSYKSRLIFLLSSTIALVVAANVVEVTSEYLNLDTKLAIRSEVRDVRLEMWRAFIAAVGEKPLYGFGWGQVSTAQFSVSEIYPQTGMTQYAHNIALDLMIWNGIPLGLLVLFFIMLMFIRMYLNSYSESGFYFFSSVSALMVHSMLEYPHAYAYFIVMGGLFFGAGAVRQQCQKFRFTPLFSCVDNFVYVFFEKEVNVKRAFFIPVIFFFAVGLSVIWYEYRLIEEDQRLLGFEAASIGTLRASRKAPDVKILDQLRGFLWVARTQSFDNLSSDEKHLVHAVAQRYPLPMPLLKRAQLLASDIGMREANSSLRVIQHIYGAEVYENTLKALNGWADNSPEVQ